MYDIWELGKRHGVVVLGISIIFVLLLGMVPLSAYAGSNNAQIPEFALKCYPGQFDPIIDPPVVELVDQFGTENVDLRPGFFVCEEALKHSDLPPSDPRHWTSYQLTGTLDFGTKVLKDQFGTETLTGTFAGALLTPATKNGQSPPNDQHLKVYGISGQITPGPVLVSDQFGTSTLIVGEAVNFLTNTFKNMEGDLKGPDMKCYAIDGETPPIDPPVHDYADQFGTTTVDPDPAQLFCVLAEKSSPTAIGGELIGIDTTAVLAAGAQYTAAWMIPVIVSGIGFAIVIARKF